MNTSIAPKLPPLPKPVDELYVSDGFNLIGTQPVYTVEQMRAYAIAAIEAQDESDAVKAAFHAGIVEGEKLAQGVPDGFGCAWCDKKASVVQQEPVGRVAWAADVPNTIKEVRWVKCAPPVDTLLYTHPAQQEPSQAASDAYDRIDNLLRQRLDDHDYTHYSFDLDLVWGAGAAQQAKQQPLTREQVKDLCTVAGYDQTPVQARADFINGIRHGEAAHGIVKE